VGWLSGGIALPILKLVSRWVSVLTVSALATFRPDKKHWFSLVWRLGGRYSWCGCFGEEVVVLLVPRFLNPYLPGFVLVIILTMLPLTDLKIIQKSISINLNGMLV